MLARPFNDQLTSLTRRPEPPKDVFLPPSNGGFPCPPIGRLPRTSESRSLV